MKAVGGGGWRGEVEADGVRAVAADGDEFTEDDVKELRRRPLLGV